MNIKLLREGAKIPTRGSALAAGYDLYACSCGEHSSWTVHTGNRMLIPTGIALNLPIGHFGRICPRSGLAVNKGISILGGVIDQDYTGEIFVLLQNNGHSDFEIKAGDRIAQLVFLRYGVFDFTVVDELTQTDRGVKGFGSTGV